MNSLIEDDLYENMVGEALTKQGYKLYCYRKDDSTLETDIHFFTRITVSFCARESRSKLREI